MVWPTFWAIFFTDASGHPDMAIKADQKSNFCLKQPFQLFVVGVSGEIETNEQRKRNKIFHFTLLTEKKIAAEPHDLVGLFFQMPPEKILFPSKP
jgi:hypothetical protein